MGMPRPSFANLEFASVEQSGTTEIRVVASCDYVTLCMVYSPAFTHLQYGRKEQRELTDNSDDIKYK
jgi:hypothetical protein